MNVQRVVVREDDCASFALPWVFVLSESVERNKKKENCKSHSTVVNKFLVSSFWFLVRATLTCAPAIPETKNFKLETRNQSILFEISGFCFLFDAIQPTVLEYRKLETSNSKLETI